MQRIGVKKFIDAPARNDAMEPASCCRRSSTRSPGRTTSGGPIPSTSPRCTPRRAASSTTCSTASRRARAQATQARILLFHGQSGAGKTHLLRALRTTAHRDGKAYFGYAQMTPDVANYADYYLRRLVHSLEKPYDPDDGGESALARLTSTPRRRRRASVAKASAEPARGEPRRGRARQARPAARRRHRRQPQVRGQELDINIVRALLYLERARPAHRPARAPVPVRPPAHRAGASGRRRARPQHRRRPRLRDHRSARHS